MKPAAAKRLKEALDILIAIGIPYASEVKHFLVDNLSISSFSVSARLI